MSIDLRSETLRIGALCGIRSQVANVRRSQPLLDEAGLKSALSWYVQGIAERSGIFIELSVSDDFGRLPADMELAIFASYKSV